MKNLILSLFLLAFSVTSFAQIKAANDKVRSGTLSPYKVANALDAMKAFTTTGDGTYLISSSSNVYSDGATYSVGDIWRITIGTTNTNTSNTLNVDSEGAIALKDSEGNDFAIGDLKAGSTYEFVYNGTHFRLIGTVGGSSYTAGSGIYLLGNKFKLGTTPFDEDVTLNGAGTYSMYAISLMEFGIDAQRFQFIGDGMNFTAQDAAVNIGADSLNFNTTFNGSFKLLDDGMHFSTGTPESRKMSISRYRAINFDVDSLILNIADGMAGLMFPGAGGGGPAFLLYDHGSGSYGVEAAARNESEDGGGFLYMGSSGKVALKGTTLESSALLQMGRNSMNEPIGFEVYTHPGTLMTEPDEYMLKFKINDYSNATFFTDSLTAPNLRTGTADNVLYINSATGEITQSAAPSGGGDYLNNGTPTTLLGNTAIDGDGYTHNFGIFNAKDIIIEGDSIAIGPNSFLSFKNNTDTTGGPYFYIDNVSTTNQFKIQNLPSSVESNVLYYDPFSYRVTYGAAPSGGGITNGAANNELMKSNGTNAVSSGLFSSSAGVLQGTGFWAQDVVSTTPGYQTRFLPYAIQHFHGTSESTLFSVLASNGSSAFNNGAGLSLVAGSGYTTSGDGSGGDVNISSGVKRAAGAGTDGDVIIDANAGKLVLTATPPNDDALTQVLVRDGTTGEVKYRSASSLTGGGGGELTDGDKGDITVSSSGTVWNIDANTITATEITTGAVGSDEIDADAVGSSEIAANAVGTSEIADANVTLAKLANIATASFIGRTTAATGVPEVLTGAQATALLTNAAADGTTKGVASFTAADFDATSGNISIDYTNGQAASGSVKGFLTSADWTTFNNKVATTRTISTTSPLSGGGDLSANRTLSIADAAADGTTKGAATFTAADFNATTGNVSIDYTNGQAASGSTKGFLTSTDWTTFNNKAATASPTFTGTVVLPSTTSIGTVSSTEIGYVDGVTSAIQTQMDAKAPLASPALTGTPTAPTAAGSTNSTQIATTAFVKTYSPKAYTLAASDETTALTTGTSKITFRMPYAMTVTGIRASLTTAQGSGSILTVDVNEGGASILSTKLTIDNSEKTSTTAATAAVLSDTSLADDAEMTIDIDQVGTGAAGLKITLIGY